MSEPVSERKRVFAALLGGALAVALASCGSGTPTGPGPSPTPPPAAHAAVTATGNGALTVHPSIDSAFGFALEVPIRIRETGGGTADWQYARMSLLKGGKEVERAEIGSTIIINGGYGRIAASSDKNVNLVFRLNSDDFDEITLELGLADLNYRSQFTAQVPFSTFTDVNFSPTPMMVPVDRVELR
jgi:hypothetical protein